MATIHHTEHAALPHCPRRQSIATTSGKAYCTLHNLCHVSTEAAVGCQMAVSKRVIHTLCAIKLTTSRLLLPNVVRLNRCIPIIVRQTRPHASLDVAIAFNSTMYSCVSDLLYVLRAFGSGFPFRYNLPITSATHHTHTPTYSTKFANADKSGNALIRFLWHSRLPDNTSATSHPHS